MFEVIMRLLLMAVGIAMVTMWIHALGESDGECHYGDCDHCPYDGSCPRERRR